MRKLAPSLQLNPTDVIDPVGKPVAHDSARRHVAGSAIYIDDMADYPDQLHVATGHAVHAHARIVSMNLDAVRQMPGVIDVIVQSDIPGSADISPTYQGDLLLSGDTVEYIGQPLFAVAATSFETAQRAVALAEVEYEVLTAVLDVREALKKKLLVLPEHRIDLGNVETAMAAAPHTLTAEIEIRGQEHFYLEGQAGAAVPTEEGGVQVFSSSQHPSEVQKLVAKVLALPIHSVQVEVRRMGGGFGGKESQAAIPACLSALFARRTGRPVRFRMSRKDDMVQTGKRHPFLNQYHAGFDDEGKLLAVEMSLAGDCGCTADLSQGIVDRAMFHADNAYFLNSARITGFPCKTHKVSNTAFRGFGGPQGMLAIESLLDDMARQLNRDPLDIRKQNLYGPTRNTTPYGQEIDDHVLPDLVSELENSCDYRQRREEITAFNQDSRFIRKGLALVPIKFGISFTATHLNQAGALVHIYTDGSIHLSHGGTEMGQGLYIKVAQVVARALGVNLERVMVSDTRTDKVPNASPTAASAGTDMNGMAALDACERIKQGLAAFAAEHFSCSPDSVRFAGDQVWIKDKPMEFGKFIRLAYMNRIPLFSSGFYRTPKIWYDRARGKGHPFYYFANGAACSEVTINSLTGEYRVSRVDILHDVGTSLNQAIDIGQIEGGFVQGMGWLTSEELLWDDKGRVISNSPANYKIPTAFDLPPDFRVNLFDRPNGEETIYRSKAVGEPPLMLAISVWCALRDACSSYAGYRFNPPLNPPATPERVYWAARQAMEYSS